MCKSENMARCRFRAAAAWGHAALPERVIITLGIFILAYFHTSTIAHCAESAPALLSDGGIEAIVSAGGAIAPLSVVGTVTVPANVTVRLSGSLGELKKGDYDLVAATALAGETDRTVIHVEQPSGSRKLFAAKIVNSKIVLTVVPQGLSLIFR